MHQVVGQEQLDVPYEPVQHPAGLRRGQPSVLELRGGLVLVTDELHEQPVRGARHRSRHVGACQVKGLQHLELPMPPPALLDFPAELRLRPNGPLLRVLAHDLALPVCVIVPSPLASGSQARRSDVPFLIGSCHVGVGRFVLKLHAIDLDSADNLNGILVPSAGPGWCR
jgi:hypothetical protein